ncbi:MAG: polysaccharide deacetylase family protein [Prevotella sp.]|nr:polysaccharide deacetylase family protein [Prevotella sp.]
MKTNELFKRNIIFLLLALPILTASAQRVRVAPYLDNKPAALSLTFDDGLLEQYTLVFPALKRLGLRATFGLIGSRVGATTSGKFKNIPCMTWEQAREMAQQGQEITSHGYAHRNVSTLSGEELRSEVQHNDTLIFEHTGIFPRTFLYPGNRKSEAAVDFCEQGRSCTRTRQISMGGKRTEEWFEEYVQDLTDQGGWGVTMTHAIVNGYDHFGDSATFFNILKRAAQLQDRLWIAPLCDVGAYVKERDNVKLKVTVKRDRVIIRPKLKLDKTIFNQPLTILVNGKPHNIDPYAKKIIIHEKL